MQWSTNQGRAVIGYLDYLADRVQQAKPGDIYYKILILILPYCYLSTNDIFNQFSLFPCTITRKHPFRTVGLKAMFSDFRKQWACHGPISRFLVNLELDLSPGFLICLETSPTLLYCTARLGVIFSSLLLFSRSEKNLPLTSRSNIRRCI